VPTLPLQITIAITLHTKVDPSLHHTNHTEQECVK
jgi:hypothetical protein